MAEKSARSGNERNVNSIRLEDFPENEGLVRDFFDREGEDEMESGTVVISRGNIPKDVKPEDFKIASVSRIFDEEELEEDMEQRNNSQSSRVKSSPQGRTQPRQSTSSAGSAPTRENNRKNSVKSYGKKKRNPALRIIKFCIFLLLWIAVAFVCYEGYKYGYDVFNDNPVDSSNLSKVVVTIEGDESDIEIGKMLIERGLIEDDMTVYRLRCIVYKPSYKAGTYKLSKSFNTEKIINILSGSTLYSDGTMEEETTAAETTAAN